MEDNFFPQYLSVHLSICLSMPACPKDFGCTQLTITIMEVNFFPNICLSIYSSVSLSIHLIIPFSLLDH